MSQTGTQSVSDIVREHVREVYVRSAAQRGERFVTVKAGAIHKALGLSNRVPLVCAALKSKKLLAESGLKIVSQTGPPSGLSTTATFTYEILGSQAPQPASYKALIALRGIAKDVFERLGGGEAFIRNERSSLANDAGRNEAAKE